MWIRYLAKQKGEDGRFLREDWGKSEGAWWDRKEQLVLIRDQKNRNDSTPPLLFVEPITDN